MLDTAKKNGFFFKFSVVSKANSLASHITYPNLTLSMQNIFVTLIAFKSYKRAFRIRLYYNRVDLGLLYDHVKVAFEPKVPASIVFYMLFVTLVWYYCTKNYLQ